jgi:hypothetical protein
VKPCDCIGQVQGQIGRLRKNRANANLPSQVSQVYNHLLFLGGAGVFAGAKIVSNDRDGILTNWGIALIIISILTSGLLVYTLVKNGMYSNRKREVREVCSGLLAYYHQLKTK